MMLRYITIRTKKHHNKSSRYEIKMIVRKATASASYTLQSVHLDDAYGFLYQHLDLYRATIGYFGVKLAHGRRVLPMFV